MMHAADKRDHHRNGVKASLVTSQTGGGTNERSWDNLNNNQTRSKQLLEDQTILLQSPWTEKELFSPWAQIMMRTSETCSLTGEHHALFCHPVLRRTQTQLLMLSLNARRGRVNGVSRHLAETHCSDPEDQQNQSVSQQRSIIIQQPNARVTAEEEESWFPSLQTLYSLIICWLS